LDEVSNVHYCLAVLSETELKDKIIEKLTF
jgi:hypothetical protein